MCWMLYDPRSQPHLSWRLTWWSPSLINLPIQVCVVNRIGTGDKSMVSYCIGFHIYLPPFDSEWPICVCVCVCRGWIQSGGPGQVFDCSRCLSICSWSWHEDGSSLTCVCRIKVATSCKARQVALWQNQTRRDILSTCQPRVHCRW